MILFSVFLRLDCNTEYFSELSVRFSFTKGNQLSWKQTIATKEKQYFWTLEWVYVILSTILHFLICQTLSGTVKIFSHYLNNQYRVG